MIDIESDVFSAVAVPLRKAFPGAFVAGEATDAPAFRDGSLAVTIIEQDNCVYGKACTARLENAAKLLYEVNVFSNKDRGKKQEVKQAMAAIDAQLERLGFTRTMCNPVKNLMDAKIYRMVARYEGIVDKKLTIYTK